MTEMADVIKFIAAFPSLSIKDATEENTSQKVHCSLTGHEMPCRVGELKTYVNGKKFNKAQERRDKEFEKYKPYIVPSNKKGKTHRLFCTLTIRHINRVPAHVERHVNGRRYKKALQRYEECERQGIKFKPLGKSRRRDEKSDSEETKKFSHSALNESSESEAESDDSMSDLYPKEDFERLTPGNEEEAADDDEEDDSASDFDVEEMDVEPQATSNGASTSAAGDGPRKRKKSLQNGGKRKAPKKQQQQQEPSQRAQSKRPSVKKGALKQPRKDKAT